MTDARTTFAIAIAFQGASQLMQDDGLVGFNHLYKYIHESSELASPLGPTHFWLDANALTICSSKANDRLSLAPKYPAADRHGRKSDG